MRQGCNGSVAFRRCVKMSDVYLDSQGSVMCGCLLEGVVMEVHGFVCSPPIYEFNGWLFEYHSTSVWPLKKNFEPRARAGRMFYKMLDEFCQLSKEEQRQHRIGGGCASF